MTRTLTTRVSAEGRVVLDLPDLEPGQTVRVRVESVEVDPDVACEARRIDELGLKEWLKTIPRPARTREEWDEYDRQLRAERDAWERE